MLTPDRELTQAVLYCFAYCARRWEIQVHWLTVMSNHYHCAVTDKAGQRVQFTHELHQLLARCVKGFHADRGIGIEGPVWDAGEQTGRLLLSSREGLVASAAYCLANPVAAGLVRTLKEWPGFVSRPEDTLGYVIPVNRPKWLSARYPRTVRLDFRAPSQFVDSPHAFVQDVKASLRAAIQAKREEFAATGERFGTAEQVIARRPSERPSAPKARAKPTFRAVTRQAVRQARRVLRAWHVAYRKAYERFKLGERGVEWPPGTWMAGQYYGARVALPGDWYAAWAR
jgi:hypothetical protein